MSLTQWVNLLKRYLEVTVPPPAIKEGVPGTLQLLSILRILSALRVPGKGFFDAGCGTGRYVITPCMKCHEPTEIYQHVWKRQSPRCCPRCGRNESGGRGHPLQIQPRSAASLPGSARDTQEQSSRAERCSGCTRGQLCHRKFKCPPISKIVILPDPLSLAPFSLLHKHKTHNT